MSKKRAYEQGGEFEAEPEPEEVKATLQEFADFFYANVTDPSQTRTLMANWLAEHGFPAPH